MRLTFIGIGSGKVEVDSFHASYLISNLKFKLLFDCGDSISRALLVNKISINSITHILISHNHPDHFSGLPNLINQMHLLKRKKDLTIYTHKNLVDLTKQFLYFNYIFPSRLNFNIRVIGFEHDVVLKIHDCLSIMPIKNNHIRNKHSVKVVKESYFISSSFVIQSDTNLLLITSDLMNENDLRLFDKFAVKYLILESTHINISTLDNYQVIKNSGKIILTHYEKYKTKQINQQLQKLNIVTKSRISFATQMERLNF